MLGFLKRKKINYSNIIAVLEKGDANATRNLLWQPGSGVVEYLPFILDKLEELKPPPGTSLTIHQQFEKGGFELVILATPWADKKIPFSPVIFDKKTEKIVGFLLPFNELYSFLSKKESSQIASLGVIWIKFTFPYHFK